MAFDDILCVRSAHSEEEKPTYKLETRQRIAHNIQHCCRAVVLLELVAIATMTGTNFSNLPLQLTVILGFLPGGRGLGTVTCNIAYNNNNIVDVSC